MPPSRSQPPPYIPSPEGTPPQHCPGFLLLESSVDGCGVHAGSPSVPSTDAHGSAEAVSLRRCHGGHFARQPWCQVLRHSKLTSPTGELIWNWGFRNPQNI